VVAKNLWTVIYSRRRRDSIEGSRIMGFQIPGPTKGKVQHFVDEYQAVVLDRPPRNFSDIPDRQALICVIDTIQYEVASYAFSQPEFSLLDDHSDFRKRTWLLMDKAKANQLSGFGKLQDH
jgi:hypothetical protein